MIVESIVVWKGKNQFKKHFGKRSGIFFSQEKISLSANQLCSLPHCGVTNQNLPLIRIQILAALLPGNPLLQWAARTAFSKTYFAYCKHWGQFYQFVYMQLLRKQIPKEQKAA